MKNNDAHIQCFLNYEKSQGREHATIQALFEKARDHKAKARYHLNLANIEPRIEPQKNEAEATKHFYLAKDLYKSIHLQIEMQVCD
jgi:hypothetical protein